MSLLLVARQNLRVSPRIKLPGLPSTNCGSRYALIPNKSRSVPYLDHACKANPLSTVSNQVNCGADKNHTIRDMKGSRKLAYGLRVAESNIDGKGCFAAVSFRRNEQIAEYVGERISFAEAECRRRAPGKKCICDVDREWSIDGSRGGNGTQYINHSCYPNSYLVVSGGRVFIHALREIFPGEEITTDYRYEMGLDQTRCNCQTASCLEKIGLTMITSEDELRACASPPINHPTLCPPEGACS